MTNFSFVHVFRLFSRVTQIPLLIFMSLVISAEAQGSDCGPVGVAEDFARHNLAKPKNYASMNSYFQMCMINFATDYKTAPSHLDVKDSLDPNGSLKSIVDVLVQGKYTNQDTDKVVLIKVEQFARAVVPKCEADEGYIAGKGAASKTSGLVLFIDYCNEIARLKKISMALDNTEKPHTCNGVEPADKIDGCYEGDELQCAQAFLSPKINSNDACKEEVGKYLAQTGVEKLAHECAEDATKSNPKCKQLCREANEIYLFDDDDPDCNGSIAEGDDNPDGDDTPGGGGSGDGGDDTDVSTASTGDDDEVTQNDVNQLAGMASQFRPGQTQYGLKAQDDGNKYQSSTNQGNGGDPRFQGGISGNANPTLTAISQRPRATDLFPSGGGSGGQGGAGQGGGGGGSPAVGGPQNNQAGGNKGGGNKRRRGGRRRNRLTDVLDGLKGNRFMGAAISEPGGDGALDPKYKNKIAENKKDKEKKAANLDPLRAAYRKGLNRNTAGQGDGFLPALYFPMIDENFSEIKERQSYTIEKGQSF